MKMTDSQALEFNLIYEQACKKMKGLIILGNYRPKKIGFFEKLKAKKTIALFEQALLIHSEHFQSLFFLGKIYQRLGNYDNALLHFEAAFRVDHTNHSILQEMSLVAMHLNQINKAIEYSKEALKRKPDDYVLLGNHSMNLLIAGLDNEASVTIIRALSLCPTDHINQIIKTNVDKVIAGQIRRPTFKESLG